MYSAISRLGVWITFGAVVACAQPDRTAWDVLATAVQKAENPDHRKEAVAAIAVVGPTSQAVATLSQVLKADKDSVVRQTAAAALGQMKATEAIPALRAALDDPSGEVAFSAAKALWDMGDPDGKKVFEEILTRSRKSGQGLVGGAMRDANRTLHDPKKLAYMGAREASGALLGPLSMGITVAHDAMKDTGAPGRALAADYLAKDCDARAVQLLEWSLKEDGNWLVKAASARGMARCGDTTAIPLLERYLSDSHEALRYQAAAAIVRLSQSTTAGATASASSPQQPASVQQ